MIRFIVAALLVLVIGCVSSAAGKRGSDERCIALETRYESAEFWADVAAGAAGASAVISSIPEDQHGLRISIAVGSAILMGVSAGLYGVSSDTGALWESECSIDTSTSAFEPKIGSEE